MDEIRPRQHALNILLIESKAGRQKYLAETVPPKFRDMVMTYVRMWWSDKDKVADKHPKWGPLVAVWDELTELYEEEIKNEDGRAPKLYARMQELYDDCMIAAGFEKTSEYSWSRKK